MNLNPIAQALAQQYGRYNWRPKHRRRAFVGALLSYRRVKP